MKGKARVLAVVPARSGSKGIRHKNMQLVGGKSLIARAGLTLQCCPLVDRAIISTDSSAYADEGRTHGLISFSLRPAKLSTDSAGAVDTVMHAVSEAEIKLCEVFDIVLIVEPTCPLRRPEDIHGAIEMLVRTGAQSVVTVSPVDSKYHPRKILRLEGKRLRFYEPGGASVIARQSLDQFYYRNGACYALTRQCLLEKQVIFGPSTRGYVVERPLVNIDEPLDLEFARFLAARCDVE